LQGKVVGFTASQREAILRANEIVSASVQGDPETMVRSFLAAIDDGSWPSVISGLCSLCKGLAARLEVETGRSADLWRSEIVRSAVLLNATEPPVPLSRTGDEAL